VTYGAVCLVTVSRLFALIVTGSALLFLALMANSLLPVLWTMFVYFFAPLILEDIMLNYTRLRILLSLIQELRNRSYAATTTL